MNITVIGVGKVGSTICERLSQEHHNIVAVDTSRDALDDLSNKADIITICGNGGDTSVLKRAGADHADLLIAVSSSDELNLLCCMAAKKLGTHHTIARVRNPEYGGIGTLMKNEMGLSMTINPEMAAVKEISRMLRFPSAAKIDLFAKGKVEIAEFVLSESSPLVNKSLIQLRNEFKTTFLVCGVRRDDAVYIPSGHFVLRAGDMINVTVSDDDVTRFFKDAGIYRQRIRSVMIIGGGRISFYLANALKKTKMNIKILEKNPERSRKLAEQLPQCTVLTGDGSNPDTLLEEGVDDVDALVSLTNIDEENAIISMFAKTRGVHKVITKINRINYMDFYMSAGIESIVSPKYITATYILRYVRAMQNTEGSEIETLHRIIGNRAEALEFLVKDSSPDITDVMIRSMKLKENIIIACIVHNDKIIIPTGNDVISKDDTVIVVTTNESLTNIKDIIKK